MTPSDRSAGRRVGQCSEPGDDAGVTAYGAAVTAWALLAALCTSLLAGPVLAVAGPLTLRWGAEGGR